VWLKRFLSGWAYSFPLAALSIASMRILENGRGDLDRSIGGGLISILGPVVFCLLRNRFAVSPWHPPAGSFACCRVLRRARTARHFGSHQLSVFVEHGLAIRKQPGRPARNRFDR
jgi:hypothetical protein